MTRRSLYLLLSAFIILAVALAGCAAPAPAGDAGEAAAPEAEGGDTSILVIAKAEDTVSLDPQRAFETLPTIIHKATYDTLVTFPPDSVETIIPSLAESWEISDDGTVYTFTLVDNATFSNGDPVTAPDVVFSFNRLKNLAGNPSLPG